MDVQLTVLISGTLLAAILAYALIQTGLAKVSDRIRSARRRSPVPPSGGAVRIRTREATYETRFLGASTAGWAFDTLAHAIPILRMGTPAIVEISCVGGAIRFRSEVVEIRPDKDAMLMRPPLEADISDRRQRKRIVFDDRPRVTLDGTACWLIDIGEGGARLASDQIFRRGDRVNLLAPGFESPLKAHILESLPLRGALRETRIIFEEPVPMRVLRKKFAPA